MPLTKGSSKAVVSSNIKEMVASGHPHRQAVAAALHNAYDSGKNRGRLAKHAVAKVMKAREGKKK